MSTNPYTYMIHIKVNYLYYQNNYFTYLISKVSFFSGMVDSLLEQFDVNEDGILDFSEFMKSFVQAGTILNKNVPY